MSHAQKASQIWHNSTVSPKWLFQSLETQAGTWTKTPFLSQRILLCPTPPAKVLGGPVSHRYRPIPGASGSPWEAYSLIGLGLSSCCSFYLTLRPLFSRLTVLTRASPQDIITLHTLIYRLVPDRAGWPPGKRV